MDKIMDKPIIIFDTDMDTDCDDAGAMAMLLQAHLAGKIELVGVVADSLSPYAARFCEVMLKHYGVDIPVGAVYESDYTGQERFDRYRTHSQRLTSKGILYNRYLSGGLEKRDGDYKRAKELYRELLLAAEDNSVTVLCVGLMTAVAELLLTEGDESSPLSGAELFSKKVRRVVTMGIPENVPDFNWGMDAHSAEVFFEKCHVPIDISPEGEEIITGATLSGRLGADHPLRRAYEIWLGKESCGRASWDLVAALSAIDENTAVLEYRPLGACRYVANETRLYIEGEPTDRHRLISTRNTAEEMADILNSYMLGDTYK